jgi:hypothetical protein
MSASACRMAADSSASGDSNTDAALSTADCTSAKLASPRWYAAGVASEGVGTRCRHSVTPSTVHRLPE